MENHRDKIILSVLKTETNKQNCRRKIFIYKDELIARERDLSRQKSWWIGRAVAIGLKRELFSGIWLI